MRNFFLLLIIAGVSLLSGCFAYQQGLPSAYMVNRGMAGFSGNYAAYSYRYSEACAKGIFGIIAFGDASIENAARQANISTITSVDHRIVGVMGYFYKFCVVVHGY